MTPSSLVALIAGASAVTVSRTVIPYRVLIGRALDALESLGEPDRPRPSSTPRDTGNLAQPSPALRAAAPTTPASTPATSAGANAGAGVVHHGPRWYRSRIRILGPVVGLVPPLVIGLAGLAVLRAGESGPTGIIGLVTGLFAAPGLLMLGAPLSDSGSYPLGIAISVLLWLLVGFVSARRATSDPLAAWPQFWRHYTWAAVGILVGVIAALFVVAVVYGESLL